MAMIDVIAFDVDDTLWHNETLYVTAKNKLQELLSPNFKIEVIGQDLDKVEVDNLQHYGYGIKSFTLSMIETAIRLTDGKIKGDEIQKIIDIGKEMLSSEVQLFSNVRETISILAKSHTLMIITKGDLLDQEKKLSQSGIDQHFDCIEIVSEKNEETYKRVLKKYHIQPERFIMVGNSLKSDILPVTNIGGIAVYVPAEVNWTLDVVDDDQWPLDGHYEIEDISQLPDLIERLSG
jgi:putative hydrolase of the HAD superfamily